PDRLTPAAVVEFSSDADNSVRFEQGDGRFGLLETERVLLDHFDRCLRHATLVNFQSHLQCIFWTEAWTDTTLLLTENCHVQLQRVAPERFRAERVVSKDPLALVVHAISIRLGFIAERVAPFLRAHRWIGRHVA